MMNKLWHCCGWSGNNSNLLKDVFIYDGIETVDYLCPKCKEPCPLFDAEFFWEEDEEEDFDYNVKSSNRKNTKPIIKVKPSQEK